jgi:hypothetical protein
MLQVVLVAYLGSNCATPGYVRSLFSPVDCDTVVSLELGPRPRCSHHEARAQHD